MAIGFDRVQLDCDKGPTVEAVVVQCAGHLPWNYYVGEVASRVTRVNGMPGARFDVGGDVTAVSLVIDHGRISRIYAMRNPSKLAHLEEVAELRR